MIDSLLLKLVNQNADKQTLDAMQADDLEHPSFYSSWISPLRTLLAMRYLKHKSHVISAFTAQGIYPVHRSDYMEALRERLQKKAWFGWLKSPEICFFPLANIVFYPAALAGLIVGSWLLHQWNINKNMELALADRMPYFSELLHRAQVTRQVQQFDLMKQYLANAENERDNIISLVPDKGAVRQQLLTSLNSMMNEDSTNSDIMIQFKNLNTELDKQKLPFYLSPKLFNVPCSSFAPNVDTEQGDMIRLLEKLFAGKKPNSNRPMCRTGIITAYHVTERRALNYVSTQATLETEVSEELPLFHVTRADRVPAADGALGLTYKSQGVGSIILMDQIKRFAEQSVLPALTFQGRSYIIPYWLQGYYDIEESITKNYKSDLAELFSTPESLRLLREAAKELLQDQKHLASSRMQQTLQRSTPGDQSSQGVLGGSLDAISDMMASGGEKPKPAREAANVEIETLIDSLLPSIEYHEAYHQIVKDKWAQPAWVATLLGEQSEQGKEASLEELGAYLTQLVYTDTGHKVWLTKLLLFSLNSMTKDQPEYYASSLIFSAMRDLYLMRDIKPNVELSVDEKVEIYKALSTYGPLDLNQLAQRAFVELFERPVVRLE